MSSYQTYAEENCGHKEVHNELNRARYKLQKGFLRTEDERIEA